MDYYSQGTQLEAYPLTYNGDEYREEIAREEEGFYSGHDFDPNNNSAGFKIKPSVDPRDLSSGGIRGSGSWFWNFDHPFSWKTLGVSIVACLCFGDKLTIWSFFCGSKLFVGGISWETTEDSFFKYFNKYGEILDSVIMMNKHSGRPRGFGFVTFADLAVVDKVLAQEHTIDGRVVEVKRTVPREDMEVVGELKTKKIFVGGIPQIFTDDELKEYFLPYGSIVEHQIMLDHKTGRSRGFGFVTFDSEDSVEKIFAVGKIHELGGKQVEIKRAEPKRAGVDYNSSSRKSYGGFGSGTDGLGGHSSRGRNDGRRDRPYANLGKNGAYGYFEGSYGGITGTTSYVGYGGYGYGFGYGGPMYCFGGYGVNSYGNPGAYGGIAVYGDGKTYERAGGYNRTSGYDSATGKVVEKDDGHTSERYHPYWK